MSIPPSETWLLQQRAHFGDRLRSLRLHRNLSQEALAHLAALDRQTVGNIERAVYATSIDTAFALAWALRVTPDMLFNDQPLDALED